MSESNTSAASEAVDNTVANNNPNSPPAAVSSRCRGNCACSGYSQSLAVPNYCNCGHQISWHGEEKEKSTETTANNSTTNPATSSTDDVPPLPPFASSASPPVMAPKPRLSLVQQPNANNNINNRNSVTNNNNNPSSTSPPSAGAYSTEEPPPLIRRESRIKEIMASYQQQVAAAQNPPAPPRPVRPPKPQALVDQLATLQSFANKTNNNIGPLSPGILSPNSFSRSLNTPFSPSSSQPIINSNSSTLNSTTNNNKPIPVVGSTMAPSNLSPDAFARNIYHKFDVVCAQADSGMKVTKRIRSFFQTFAKIQEKAAIETQKAANTELTKLLQMKNPDKMGSAHLAWKNFFEKMSKLSYAHQNLCADINAQCVEPLNTFHSVGSTMAHQSEEEAKKINSTTDQLKIQVNKERENIRQLLAQLNEKKEVVAKSAEKESGTNTTEDNVKKAFSLFGKTTSEKQKDLEKVREKAHAACTHYEQTVIQANAQHQKNMHELPNILNQIQSLEEMRLNSLNAALLQFSKVTQSFHERIANLSEDLSLIASTMNAENDMNSFIELTIREYGPANSTYNSPFYYDIGMKPDDLKAETFNNTSGLFYSTLEEIMKYDKKQDPSLQLDVPKIVPVLISSVESLGGFQSEGIFRISVTVDELNNLRKQLEKGDYNVKVSNPHIPAALLKTWLRDLAEPLVPDSFYSKCIEISKQSELTPAQQNELKEIVKKLPLVNRRVVFHLIMLMKKLLAPEHIAKSRMSVPALAIVFSPSFLRSTSTDPMVQLQESKPASQFVQLLIEYYATVFGEEFEWAKSSSSGFDMIPSGINLVGTGITHNNNNEENGHNSGSAPNSSSPLTTTGPISSSVINFGSSNIDISQWQSAVDPNTGLTYYFNTATQERTWTKPPGL